MVLKKNRPLYMIVSGGLAVLIFTFFASFVSPAQATPASVYEKALASYSRGDCRKTIRLLKEYVKDHPEAESYYLLGYASYKLGHLKAAKIYFSDAYLIDPGLNPKKIKYYIRTNKL
ncbi:MAG: hypothetical protein M0Z61_05095 [Nitrospiraceae bacterium]|nr:hypothetical protein [Nitrospiraceae bacterium]